MEIRLATREDLPEIVRIYNEAIDEQVTGDTVPLFAEDRTDWFAAHPPDGYPILVAEAPGAGLRGWASLSAYRPGRWALRHTAELSYYVARQARRDGVGRALVAACIERARTLELRSLIAILLDENAPSRSLLESFDFEQWGHLPGVAHFGDRRVGHLYYGRHVD